MDKTCPQTMVWCPPLSAGTIDLIKRLTAFAACIMVIALFMFVIGPKGEQSDLLRPMAEFIEEHDINANVYFYTEVEEFSEANINMENTMAYPPRKF